MDNGALRVRDDDYYTLLGVREDGIASIVDLVVSLLTEHRSCQQVEVWRDGALLDTIGRGLSA
jgi:hypothetical protein